MTIDQVQRGLRRGELIEGVLRINPKKYEDAYIAAPAYKDGAMDIFICGRHDQNGALNGDNVAVQLLPVNEWKILHERVLDTLPKLTKEQFRELYANKDFSSRPEVAEMVDMARKGLLMDFNLLNVDDVDDSSVAGMVGGSFSDPNAMFGRFFRPGQDTDDEDGEEKPPDRDPGGQVKVLDLRNQEIAPEDEDECDVIIDKSSDDERAEDGNCFFGESDEDGHATPVQTSTSVAVPPDEFLGASFAHSESDEEDGVSDGEAEALQRVEDVEALRRLEKTDDVPEKSTVVINGTDEPKTGCDPALEVEKVPVEKENSDDYEDVDEEPEEKPSSAPKTKKNRRKERSRSKKTNRAAGFEVKTVEMVQVVSTPEARVETTVVEREVKVSERRRSNRRGGRDNRSRKRRSDVKEVNLDCGLEPKDVIMLSNWGTLLQRRGRVVAIVKRNHSGRAIGFFKPQNVQQRPNGTPGDADTPGRRQFTIFSPVDSRIPRIKIPTASISSILQHAEECQKTMYLAQITKWTEPDYALGEIVGCVGEAGDIEAETTAILLQNGIDDTEFDEKILNCLPPIVKDQLTGMFRFPVEEFEYRTDFTTTCVFTVDPETARDLDDAISIRDLPGGLIEVGVHIADVSFYVPEGTELDRVASDRATSVYLVQRVVPMLPRPLCEHLCSLNPGEPKLTFSVVWQMKADGTVLDYWIGRTVISSVAKLSYGHAQAMIECDDVTKLNEADFPKFFGNFDLQFVAKRMKELNTIAMKMRKERYGQGGALSLDLPKPFFRLNQDTGLPDSFNVYERKDSHKMIEELMLLANMTVAEYLHKQLAYQPALLRRHPPPNGAQLGHLVHTLKILGHEVDASSSQALNEALTAMRTRDPIAFSVITFLFARPMKLAEYFVCIRGETMPDECRHYALNVPFYTHFTSPIRRYADVMVHRLLAAALRIGPRVAAPADTLKLYAANCNGKKDASKKCSDESLQLYFNVYLASNGPVTTHGIVTIVNDRSFDVFLPEVGLTGRIYIDRIGMKSCNFSRERGRCVLKLLWAPASGDQVIQQTIQVFDKLTVQMSSNRNGGKFTTNLVPPEGAVVTKTKTQEKNEAENAASTVEAIPEEPRTDVQ
jgi:DIS3-like exonuclease 2